MDGIDWFFLPALISAASTALTAAAPWVAGASAAVGAYGAIKAGKQQSASLKGQAAAAETEARIAELGVKQTAARRTEALMADIGAIRARRATQNVGANSGSAVVAEKAYEKEYLQSMRSEILNQRYGIVSRLTSAAGLRAGAKGAMLSGYASAVGSLAGGFASFGSTSGPSAKNMTYAQKVARG